MIPDDDAPRAVIRQAREWRKRKVADHDPAVLSISHGGLRLDLRLLPAYSHALRHAGTELVAQATATNLLREPQETQSATLVLDHLELSWRLAVPRLAPLASASLRLTPLATGPELLEQVTAGQTTTATVQLGDQATSTPLLLLGIWDWPMFDAARTALAAMVLPNDGVVRSIIAGVGGDDPPAESSAGDAAIDSLRQLYTHLADAHEIRYAGPMAVRYAPDRSYQTIRPPHRVVFNLRDRQGEGTCLDLSLLLAGCLEGSGISPVVLLLGSPGTPPAHAIVAIWRSGRTRFRPLIEESAKLREAIERGALIPLEATGICTGEERLSFQDALQTAREKIQACEWLQAIDVGALRPPNGHILPLEMPLDPPVLRAYTGATDLARQLGTPIFETLHLLFGIVTAEGDTCRQLLAESGASAERIAQQVRNSLEGRSGAKRPGRTRSYDHCLSEARENARTQGSTTVRESDLLWAILWSQSNSIGQALEAAGSSREALVQTLARICPQNRPETTVS